MAKATNTKAKVATPVQAGPRGFRFGATFIQSVIDGVGVATKPANINKVLAFAKALDVKASAKSPIEDTLKSMKTAAKKYFNAHYEVA